MPEDEAFALMMFVESLYLILLAKLSATEESTLSNVLCNAMRFVWLQLFPEVPIASVASRSRMWLWPTRAVTKISTAMEYMYLTVQQQVFSVILVRFKNKKKPASWTWSESRDTFPADIQWLVVIERGLQFALLANLSQTPSTAGQVRPNKFEWL